MALHRPAEGQLNRVQGTDDLVETTDGFPIEILPDQESGRDCEIVLDCCRCQHLYHQCLRLLQHYAPRPHIDLKSFETCVKVLRKSLCQVQPMSQDYMTTVRAQDFSISYIFKWHRKPSLVSSKGKRFLSCC